MHLTYAHYQSFGTGIPDIFRLSNAKLDTKSHKN